MKKFVIALAPEMPETPVYLGLCTTANAVQVALFAAQGEESPDVGIGYRDLASVTVAINAGDSTRPDDPEWIFERADLRQARVDLINQKHSKFVMNDSGTINLRGGGVIAVPLSPGALPVAVCEVTGASAAHLPSWGAYDSHGHFSVGRFKSHCLPC